MPITDLHFLIAEDHDFQRRMLVRLLENLGAKSVLDAADGHAALKVFENTILPVDIVISDLDMPGMDGMEFIRHLGQTGMPVALILVSALESKLIDSVAIMARAYGVVLLGIVEKPLTIAKLEPLIKLHKPARPKSNHPHAVGPTFTLGEIAGGLKNNEFEPFFQPKVELTTGRIKGAEALARWRHAEHGIVAPYAFIKPLEDNGMIDELTWTMLKKAADFCVAWRATGADITISVNLSLKSLSDVKVADHVTELVRSKNLDPRHIMLEVTESAATTDVGEALENLARLRMKGFGLSIDDYGTGYSSMQQLARIAFTEIKIDQSFVANAATQESARVILQSSLDMAKKLKITAVAEGVEAQADWNLLREIDCDVAQGYFIARPLQADAFLEWAKTWRSPT